MSYYGTSENEPLISNNDKKVKTKNYSLGTIINRVILLIIFSLLLSSTIYLNSSIQKTQKQLTNQTQTISKLALTLSQQDIIIRRFNTTVTNKDVLRQVNSLRDELQKTEKDMMNNLADVEGRVDVKLKDTMGELNGIVEKAQKQIQSEVDQVHYDVESYVRTTQDQFSTENNFMVFQLAGTFTLLAALISMWHMTAHLRHFYEPTIQRKVLAILWMCPIYAVTSWLSLVFIHIEGYLGILKDFYEAYTIYTFLSFLISVLGKGDRNAVIDLLVHHADHLADPRTFGFFRKMHYDSPREKAALVLNQCQAFAMQFVLFKPLVAVLRFLCKKMDWHGFAPADSSDMDPRSPQFYFFVIDNVSVFLAFSGLLKFYHAVQEDLAWCRPFPKFLCIKGVVFMTFWQSLAIGILAATTQDFGDDVMQREVNREHWAGRCQAFLICLEMLLFSIAHFYCFPFEEWEEGYKPKEDKDGTTFIQTMAMDDFVRDMKLVMRGNKKKKVKDSTSNNEDSDSSTKITAISEQDEEDVSASVNSKESVEGMNTKGKEKTTLENIIEEDDDDDEKEEVNRALTRLTSNKILINTLRGSLKQTEEILEYLESQEEANEEVGFVKVEEKEAKEQSNKNITDQEEKDEENLNPSIFTSLGI